VTLITRRRLLGSAVLSAAGAALPDCFRGSRPPPLPRDAVSATPWPEANAILASIRLPAIPSKSFEASSFGASGKDETFAIQSAIDAAWRAGGGRVEVAPGEHPVGALRLRSRVDLHLAAGASLIFSEDARRFPPVFTRYEGVECVNRSPLVYAQGESDIAISGEGTLDASRTGEWNRGADRGFLESLVARGVEPTARRVVDRLRTSFVQPYQCARVLIQGVTLTGSPFWQLHPVLCSDVTVEGVTTSVSGANSDGCDPESCDRVVVRGCTLASGDDNIALKSGRDTDGRRLAVPCRNVVIAGCQAEGRFGFLCCGSELSGGIENVFAYRNRSYGQGIGSILWVKSNTRRGGYVRNVRVADFHAGALRTAVVSMTTEYAGQEGDWLPRFSDIELSGLTVESAPRVLDLKGLAAAPMGPVVLRDSTFGSVEWPDRIEHAVVLR
jgi:polygalacturonase